MSGPDSTRAAPPIPRGPLRPGRSLSARPGAARGAVVLGALLAAALLAGRGAAAAGEPPVKFAGTYRIEHWRDLEARHLYHFFYLHPSGRFYLAGEWPGSESSRFAGTWAVAGEQLDLSGVADVKTSQGSWKIPFHRSFRVEAGRAGLRLVPLPEKNRYGLMGWPDAFVFLRAAPAPNLPEAAVPEDEGKLLALSAALAPPGSN